MSAVDTSQRQSGFFVLLGGESEVLQGQVGQAPAKHVLLQEPISLPSQKKDPGALSSDVTGLRYRSLKAGEEN